MLYTCLCTSKTDSFLVKHPNVPQLTYRQLQRAKYLKVSISDFLTMFSLEIQCRRVSNAEQVDWKASRATSGTMCFVEVHISGGVHQVVVQVGAWQRAFRRILVCEVIRDVTVSCR